MNGFEVDPKERARVRRVLPPELLATVDNAEIRMNEKINGLVEGFKSNIQSKIAEFTERDFSEELEKSIEAEGDLLVKELSESVGGISDKINAINKAVENSANQDQDINLALAALKEANVGLDKTLNDARSKVKSLGQKAASIAKSSVSRFLTGIF